MVFLTADQYAQLFGKKQFVWSIQMGTYSAALSMNVTIEEVTIDPCCYRLSTRKIWTLLTMFTLFCRSTEYAAASLDSKEAKAEASDNIAAHLPAQATPSGQRMQSMQFQSREAAFFHPGAGVTYM